MQTLQYQFKFLYDYQNYEMIIYKSIPILLLVTYLTTLALAQV